jgi:DNA repair exonuclease SbcCD ATPase subunit
MNDDLGEKLERSMTDSMSEHYIARISRLTDEANGLRGKLAALSVENVELGKRYDELERMVERRVGELEAENEHLRAELEAAKKPKASNELRCAYCLSKPAQSGSSWCAECDAELTARDNDL